MFIVVAGIPDLVPPVCSQKAFPGAHNVPYYFYHCPPIPTETSYILPDLQINVDFGPLMDGLSNIAQTSARTQLPLLIGLANDLYDDIVRTVPVAFLPGVNMAASVIVDVRQVYTNGALAALGMFEVSLYFHRSPRFLTQIDTKRIGHKNILAPPVCCLLPGPNGYIYWK